MKPSQVMTHISMAEMRGTSLDDLKAMLANEDFSQGDEFGSFPIHDIATVKRDLVDFAVERGADVNIRNGEGYTPLHIAIAHVNEDVVSSLLRHGAQLDLSDRYGNIPLVSAVYEGKKASNVIRMLRDAGADPDAKGSNGRSAREMDNWNSIAGDQG